MNDNSFREILISALTKGHAHLTLHQALENISPETLTVKPAENLHSVWQLLEHIRISQLDILKYIIDPDWKSPQWPDEYWPGNENVTQADLEKSISKFDSDISEIVAIINNPQIDVTSIIPHTKEHTYLREILLVIDHNSYHIGQIVETRKLLNDWNR